MFVTLGHFHHCLILAGKVGAYLSEAQDFTMKLGSKAGPKILDEDGSDLQLQISDKDLDQLSIIASMKHFLPYSR